MKCLTTLATILSIVIVLTCAEGSGLAQAGSTPETTVHDFYQWYLHTLNAQDKGGKPPEKYPFQMSKFLTQRLVKAYNRALKRPDGINADYFIDAQDWDPIWEQNISTSKAMIQGDAATVIITLKGGEAFGNKTLRVGLRKEAGVWKIDRVNGRANP